MWPLLLLLFSAHADETYMVDANGQRTSVASRPVVTFVTCITGQAFDLDLDKMHIQLEGSDSKIVKTLDYDDLQIAMLQPVRVTLDAGCAGVSFGTWMLWHRAFGLPNGEGAYKFHVHLPVTLHAFGATQKQLAINSSPASRTTFSCTVSCWRSHDVSAADTAVAWTLVALFLVCLFFLAFALTSNDFTPQQKARVDIVVTTAPSDQKR